MLGRRKEGRKNALGCVVIGWMVCHGMLCERLGCVVKYIKNVFGVVVRCVKCVLVYVRVC